MSHLEKALEPDPRYRLPGLLRRTFLRQSPRRLKMNAALRACAEVLGMDHLHYGLWEDEPLDMAGLTRAQERYAATLADWIPDGVRSILDVGSGVGTTAKLLASRGYEVEGMSPDPYQQEVFQERTGLPFHLVRLQEFRPKHTYDLVLMSESAQYVWLEALFPAIRRCAPGGWLLLADYFVVLEGGGGMSRGGHPLDAFLAAASLNELELKRREDVTAAAARTLDLGLEWIRLYGAPSLQILVDAIAAKRPRTYRLFRWALRSKLERLGDMERLMDSEAFQRFKRYELQLYRVPPG